MWVTTNIFLTVLFDGDNCLILAVSNLALKVTTGNKSCFDNNNKYAQIKRITSL